MKGTIVSVLVVAALLVGVLIGYLGNTQTTTVTKSNTLTATTTITMGTGIEQCVVVEYHVWSVESLLSGTTIGGTSTQSYPVTTFLNTGFPMSTTVTSYPTGTITGQIAYWNSTSCN